MTNNKKINIDHLNQQDDNEAEEKTVITELNARVTSTLEKTERKILIGIIKKLAQPEDNGLATPEQVSFYVSTVIYGAYLDVLHVDLEKLANAH